MSAAKTKDPAIRRPLRLTRLAAACAAAALLLPLGAARAQTTPLPEVQVTPSAIPDFEFDSARRGRLCGLCNFGDGNSRFVFTNAAGEMWLANVDFATGGFVPSDGRGQLIDVHTAPVTLFGNGPEWIDGLAGSQIAYTRFLDFLVPSEGSAQVAVARQTGPATWSTAVLPGTLGRATPDGTKDPDDAAPRINYIEANKTALFWRSLANPDVEVVLPISDYTEGNSRRWVPGTRKIIFQGNKPGDPRLLDQVFLFDTDTNQLEQLTTDTIDKAGAFMWRAPEFRNEYVFFTMADFRREIRVYRALLGLDGTRRWTVIKTIKAPPQLPYFWSPEVFTHNGRSYIFTQVSPSNKFFDKAIPTHLAIMSIDPLRQDFRMLTNDSSKPRVRLDPEFFITAQGPFIYYNRLIPATEEYPDGINDGVWRVDTRLGPPR